MPLDPQTVSPNNGKKPAAGVVAVVASAPATTASTASNGATQPKNGAASPGVTFANRNGTTPIAKVVGEGAGAPNNSGPKNGNSSGNSNSGNSITNKIKNLIPTTFPASPEDTWLSFKILGIFLIVALGLFFLMRNNIFGRIYTKMSSAPSDANNENIVNRQLGILRDPTAQAAERRKGIFGELMSKIKESFRNVKESFLSASDLAALPELPGGSAAVAAVTENPLLRRMEAGELPKVALPNMGLNLLKAGKKEVKAATALKISSESMPPEDERALLNFAVLGCRVTGYLGPRMNGVFSEERAVEAAIQMGCRLLVLDIDYLDSRPSRPVLVCRDDVGNLLSNNTGSISKVAASIIAYTRKQRGAGTDPILVLLNIHRLPGTQPKGRQALQFMSEIARQLAPMYQYLLRSIEEGDAQQQRLQDILFKLPITRFENQVILLTNVDTSGFRDRDEEFEPQRDLDLLVNARVFTNEDKALKNFQFPDASVPAAAVANTWSYYTTIPPANYTSEIEKTRNTFSIAMMR